MSSQRRFQRLPIDDVRSTEMDSKKLIHCVRSKPQLWNKHDPLYRKLELKKKLWKEIYHEMGGEVGVAELKQRWHNLRDVFRKELRAVRSKGKTGKMKRWMYYEDMLFLSSHIGLDAGPASKSERDTVGELEHEISLPLKTEVVLEDEDYLSHYSETDPEANEEVVEPTVQIHTMHDAVNMKALKSNIENDDYHFAMSIVPHMQKIPMHKKLKIRIKISEIIAEESQYSGS